jgi:hypothetical protein
MMGFFFGVFALVAMWEAVAPGRSTNVDRWARWPSNLGIVALNTVLVRLLLPFLGKVTRYAINRRQWAQPD